MDTKAGIKRARKKRFLGVLADIYAVLMYTLFYIPVAVMIAFSFNDAKRNFSWEGFTTGWYVKLFSFRNTTLWDALIYSLVIAVLATLISTVVGVLGGIGLGEAGPEAILPLDPFWKRMDEIANNTQGGNTINIIVNGADKDPRAIAEEVKRVLVRETNQRRLAWQ